MVSPVPENVLRGKIIFSVYNLLVADCADFYNEITRYLATPRRATYVPEKPRFEHRERALISSSRSMSNDLALLRNAQISEELETDIS